MPTRDERYRREQEHRDRYRQAAADLRHYAGMRAVAEPVLPPALRQLILSCAVICEAVSRGAELQGPVMRQGVEGLATASVALFAPPPRRMETPHVQGAWAMPSYEIPRGEAD